MTITKTHSVGETIQSQLLWKNDLALYSLPFITVCLLINLKIDTSLVLHHSLKYDTRPDGNETS